MSYCRMTYARYILYLVYTRYTTMYHIEGIPSIYLSYYLWIFGGLCLVYVYRYIPCNLKSGDPVRSRIAIEMQWHTVFGLKGCLIFSTELGVATGHPSTRACQDPTPADASEILNVPICHHFSADTYVYLLINPQLSCQKYLH
jgi:hypothetical protein